MLGEQQYLGDGLFGMRLSEVRNATSPVKGEFVPPSEQAVEVEEALPEQEEFWRPPARFGTVPVEENPLGWDIILCHWRGEWNLHIRRLSNRWKV